MKIKKEWNVVCACGCGGNVPKPKRISRGKPPIFIRNHWWNVVGYKERVSERSKKRTKLIPDISPCVGRRFRGGKYYSRVLMEESLGKKLLSHEHVHHINGDKSDDRIENLIVLTKAQHVKLHHEKEKIKFNCDFCGKPLQRQWCSYKRAKHHYCNKECFDSNSLKRKLSPKEYSRYFYEKSKSCN
jgi:HNH endonuclease